MADVQRHVPLNGRFIFFGCRMHPLRKNRGHRMVRQPRLLTFAICLAAACFSETALAQLANSTVQLPTFRVTQFNSSFSVPDGGTINLSSIGRRDYLPGAISGGTSSASASAHVLIMKELEQKMLSNSAPQIRQSVLHQRKINGTPTTQSKADFISRNINRR